MQNKAQLVFPDDIPIESELKDLISHLITHEERERSSWKQFFDHPYVVRVMGCNQRKLLTDGDFNFFNDDVDYTDDEFQ